MRIALVRPARKVTNAGGEQNIEPPAIVVVGEIVRMGAALLEVASSVKD